MPGTTLQRKSTVGRANCGTVMLIEYGPRATRGMIGVPDIDKMDADVLDAIPSIKIMQCRTLTQGRTEEQSRYREV